MSTTESGHESPGVPPAHERPDSPDQSDSETPPDTQVGMGDDAAGAVGSAAPVQE